MILIFVAVGFNGFGQLKKFTVEIPYPPQYPINDSIQSFLLMNRALTPNFSNEPEDSLQISFYKRNFNVQALILDSLAADSSLRSLGNLLFESDRYDIVIPLERNIYRLLPHTETPEPLSWNFVEALCRQFQTDALIVLENLALRTITHYKSLREYYDYTYERTYYASIDFYYRAHWRIYDPAKQQILVDYITSKDTLYWDSNEFDLATTFQNLPTVKQAAIEAAIKTAIDLNTLITPKWRKETRYYYVVNNDSIDQSIRLAAEGKWEDARENWATYSQTGSNNLRSKVLFNLALAQEMTGNLDEAIHTLGQSQKLFFREVTRYYLDDLQKRKSARK